MKNVGEKVLFRKQNALNSVLKFMENNNKFWQMI